MNEKDEGDFDLAVTVDRLSQELASAYTEQKRLAAECRTLYERERQVRKNLLKIHGFTAMFIGLAVICFGAPTSFEETLGTWTRPVMGWLAVCSGLSLWAGQNLRRYNKFYDALGVSLVGVWDILVCGSFLLTYASGDYTWRLLFPFWNHPELANQLAIYPIFVYFGFALMLLTVHLPAILRDTHYKSE